MWFRQIAQLSTTMSQAQSATAFHFLTSNLFLLSPPLSPDPDLVAFETALALEGAEASTSGISTSAIVHELRAVMGQSRCLDWFR